MSKKAEHVRTDELVVVCMKIYRKARDGSDLQIKAFEKALELAESVDEYMNIYGLVPLVPSNSSFKVKALDKALELTKSFDECMNIYDLVLRNCSLEVKVLEKALEVKTLDKALELAKSFDECMNIYDLVPNNSNLEVKALEKALEFAESVDDYTEIYQRVPDEK